MTRPGVLFWKASSAGPVEGDTGEARLHAGKLGRGGGNSLGTSRR